VREEDVPYLIDRRAHMRSTITRYLNNTISRRGFMKNMLTSGFTLASADSILKSLEYVTDTKMSTPVPSRTVVGSGGDLLVQQIKAARIKYVFTNTGSYEVGFFDALVKEPDI